jgi:CheY-like chemotaxis protein
MKPVGCSSGTADFVWGLLRLFTPARKGSAPLPKPSAPAVSESPAASNGKKILLVDDDPVILETTSSKLRCQGYAVVTGGDSSEAIGLVRDEKPDLILLDITFPPNVAQGGAVAWDGFVLMSWLRQFQETRCIPIFVITGGHADNLEGRSLKAGAKGFFRKPIDHERLLARIKETLGGDPDGARQDSAREFQI